MTQLTEQEKREIREQIKQEFYKHFNNVLNSPVLDEIYHTFDLISSNDGPCVYFVKCLFGFFLKRKKLQPISLKIRKLKDSL